LTFNRDRNCTFWYAGLLRDNLCLLILSGNQ